MEKGSYGEHRDLIYKAMIRAIKTEIENGRHPVIKTRYSKPEKIYQVDISSEQINERLEMRGAEYLAFKKLLADNGLKNLTVA
jgi:hypothetical protein